MKKSGWAFYAMAVVILAGCSPQPLGPEMLTGDRLVAKSSVGTTTSAPTTTAGDAFTFIMAGDPQIGGWVSVEETKAHFIELARQANAMKPAFVLVVGDLVNDGPNEKELAAFEEALKEFRVPVKLIPGNHDNLATYRQRFGADYYHFDYDNCEFVCVNSCLMNGPGVSGEAKAQWAWLEQTLADARARGRAHIFLVMHHPPITIPLGEVRLERLIRKYGVDFVLAGHIHRTREEKHTQYRLYTVAGTGWAMDKNGLGYRVFSVSGPTVEQRYVRLSANSASAPAITSQATSR